MFRVGIRSILSELLRQDRLIISAEVLATTPKTKALKTQLNAIESKRTLIVVNEVDINWLWLRATFLMLKWLKRQI